MEVADFGTVVGRESTGGVSLKQLDPSQSLVHNLPTTREREIPELGHGYHGTVFSSL